MATIGLSVVLPAFNEEDILSESINDLVEKLRERRGTFEVLIVENGSTDRTRVIAAELSQALPEVHMQSLPSANYGAALRSGFFSATGKLVAFCDVDYYDIAFINEGTKLFQKNKDLVTVVGSKRAKGAADTRAWYRKMITFCFTFTLKVLFGTKRTDTHGMKMFRRAEATPIVDQCVLGKDLFDTELVLRVERAGMQTDEVPVVVRESRPSRSPIVRRIPRTIVGILRLWMAMRRR